MNKPFTPAQRVAYRYPNLSAMGDALVPVPAGDLAALLDAADERDRLAADLDALRQRAEQGAALPQPPPTPTAVSDPDLYARMSRPRPAAEANAASAAFWQDVCAARERHGVRDMVVVCTFATVDDAGKPAVGTSISHRGDVNVVIPLLAYALRFKRREMDRRLDDLAAGRDEEG